MNALNVQLEPRRMTLEDYFELDRTAEGRYEFYDGEVFQMSGVSPNHADIEANLIALLKNKLAGRGCKIHPANLGVKVPAAPPFRYPDLSVLCGVPVFENIGGLGRLVNLTLIVEVLSPSTEAFDRGEKFKAYKSILSFSEYLLIAQDKLFVTLHTRLNEKFWRSSDYGAGETLRLESVDCGIGVDEIYAGIAIENLQI